MPEIKQMKNTMWLKWKRALKNQQEKAIKQRDCKKTYKSHGWLHFAGNCCDYPVAA
jgi:hypothetical protein